MEYDIKALRSQFPALGRMVNGFLAVYFDSPGGTQVPQRVIDKMVEYLVHFNANAGGMFITSAENDAMILRTRQAFADLFGCSWNEVSFGENSTAINFRLSQAIARDLQPGDEIIITDIDHDGNRSPWELLAERGIVVKSVAVDPITCTLNVEDYKNKLSSKTKVVAFNYASNAVGTITNAKEMIRLAHEAGAITVVDAVHYALHGVIDVKEIDADYLFCSAYKFFGPHIGVLYSKRERLEKLRTLKVSAQKNTVPEKFETGTLNHEGLAGAAEAVEFIADFGVKHLEYIKPGETHLSNRRKNIISGMRAFEEYEMPMARHFKSELSGIEGLTLYSPPDNHPCTSTISFRIKQLPPLHVAKLLAEKGIFVWAGGFYAVALMKLLGVAETGGMVRIGLAPYNTKEEIERTLAVIRNIAS
jgi:cysteine desulfurase family protein (TIGR01976 family)